MASHTLPDRRRIVVELMREASIERLICCGNGHHMIDLDNPIAHMTGYRSVGPALLTIEKDGSTRLITSPASESEPAARHGIDAAQAVDDLGAHIVGFLSGSARSATVGLSAMPRRLGLALEDALGPGSTRLEKAFWSSTAAKTDDEIAAARRATVIAELGYERLLETARPGIRECDLAIDINLFMRGLGANDSFLMLNCGARQDAVMPSSERRIEHGDLLLCELSPSVLGQFTQICRTVSIGGNAIAAEKYPLLVAGMNEGIASVAPGRRLGDVCQAIDDHLSAAGYAAFSRPPFIRRRGHGLGSGSTAPGDVSVENDTILKPGMLFMVHPNQFLPETGYMMCGEPVLVTEEGSEVLTRHRSALVRPLSGSAG